MASGQSYLALRRYIEAAQLYPKAEAPLLRIAQLHESGAHYDLAIRALHLAAKIDEHKGSTAQRLGFLWLQVGDQEQARLQFVRALQLDPTLWACSMGLGLVAEREGELASARHYYDAAKSLEPLSAELLAYSARVHLALQDVDHARADASLSLTLKPLVVARLVLGDIAAGTGDYTAALGIYQSVLSPAVAYERLGEQAMSRTDYAAAVRFLESAASAAPMYFESAYQQLAVAREHVQNQAPSIQRLK